MAAVKRVSKHNIRDAETGEIRRKRAGEGNCYLSVYSSPRKVERAMRRGKLPVIEPTEREMLKHAWYRKAIGELAAFCRDKMYERSDAKRYA